MNLSQRLRLVHVLGADIDRLGRSRPKLIVTVSTASEASPPFAMQGSQTIVTCVRLLIEVSVSWLGYLFAQQSYTPQLMGRPRGVRITAPLRVAEHLLGDLASDPDHGDAPAFHLPP